MMTTLQIVLAIVGVSLIAIIVIYNILQERKFRKEADRMFSHNRDDFMLGEAVRGEAGQSKADGQSILSDSLAAADAAHQATDAAKAVRSVFEIESALPARPAGAEPVAAKTPAGDTAAKPATVAKETKWESVAPRAPAQDAVPAPKAGVPPTAPKENPVPPKATPIPAVPPKPTAPPAKAPELVAPAPAAPPVQKTPTPTRATAPAREADAQPAVAGDKPQAREGEHAGAQGSGLDAGTEYIARLKFTKPQLADFSALLGALRRIGKPVRAFAARADGSWEPLSGHPRSLYEQVEFGLQLADRGGALSPEQLDAFCRALYEFAAEEGGAVTCPDKEELLQKARELDLFCMDVDVLIGLNVVSAESRPFTSEAMHSLAQDARMSLEADGAYHARDDFGHTLFTLANQGEDPFPRDGRGLTTRGVTLLFDVPRVADGIAVFDRMTRLGFDLAWRLEGRLVDDNGRAVSEESLGRDRARLAQYFARMEARGIPAGGERALRLFI